MKSPFYCGLLLALTVSAEAAGACQNGLPANNPNPIYLAPGDGTVTDTRTALMWKQCSEGQTWTGSGCNGAATVFAWSVALGAGVGVDFAGSNEWRLPNIRELESLIEGCQENPAINGEIFPGSPTGNFWSSSPDMSLPGSSWYVNFSSGAIRQMPRSGSAHVRLVRVAP